MILCILLGVALCSFIKFSSLNSVLKIADNGSGRAMFTCTELERDTPVFMFP